MGMGGAGQAPGFSMSLPRPPPGDVIIPPRSAATSGPHLSRRYPGSPSCPCQRNEVIGRPITLLEWYRLREWNASISRGTPEELGTVDLAAGMRLPLDRLKELQERHGFETILYFDEDLARNSTLDADYSDFRIVPMQARPFMPLTLFLKTAAEREEFARQMQEEPPVVEVLEIGTIDHCSGCVHCVKQYVKALLL
mgnify:FL=1